MRKSQSLDPILSRPTQEILAAMLLGPGKSVYLSDLAKRLHRAPSTLQRPLDALVRAGILTRAADGNRVYFAAAADCPILKELRDILRKTVGVVGVARDTLSEFAPRIEVALVYGSMARGEEVGQSDVDLLIIGDMTLAKVAPALRRIEKSLQRPVNAVCLTAREFREKVESGSHYLNSVLAGEKLFVLGGQDELDTVLAKRTDRAARHDESRGR